jgi:hypothetical protein
MPKHNRNILTETTYTTDKGPFQIYLCALSSSGSNDKSFLSGFFVILGFELRASSDLPFQPCSQQNILISAFAVERPLIQINIEKQGGMHGGTDL